MPSEAYITFTANLEYVKRILDIHKKSALPSRREGLRLNYINHSTMITLCASWEQYIEDVVLNSVDVLIQCTDNPLDLPEPVQKKIGASIKNSKNDLGLLNLAITDWKRTYDECIRQATDNFHSPKCKNIDALLNQSIGVTYKVFSDPASCEDSRRLDDIINTRNVIAHRVVRPVKQIRRQKVTESMWIISRLATNTDNYLNRYLARIHPNRIPPWD